ncbi:haloacid dehalogenase-like hydrolase domain-containing protein 2 [Coprinopsis sp. MPI-PUGE-AT-0042]|nr:haloacid dehalogenase-like hydrolase domain-containing protein 2 [Coprinopsis sp. MPI-PUGE-AT-0042]
MPTRPRIKTLLIDISGTLQIGAKQTKDAAGALQRLRASQIPFKLCSNSSKESTQDLIARLRKLGFVINDSSNDTREVWTSIGSVSHTLGEMGLKRPYTILSGSAREEVIPSSSHGSSSKQAPYDSVVVGLAPKQFDYDALNTAFRILTGEHGKPKGATGSRRLVPLIATHKARFIEKDDPPGLSLGPGPFVTALETAAGIQAHIVGKPTKAFFQMVINDFETDMNDTEGLIAVIGDDIEADLGQGALELGLWRVLVRTGKYRSGDEGRSGTTPPDEVFDSFADFVDAILSTQRPSKARSRL